MVGDSIGDILAGNNENLTTVAVTYGYETEAVLAEQDPTYLINSFSQLKDLIQQ
jgi:phosphoglycolate phosphatase-like HAD superfamily hydrolase